jgi:hypothetical protein
VDQHFENLSTLDIARASEAKLGINSWVSGSIRESEEDKLRDAAGVVAERPAHVESQVFSTTGGLVHMVNHHCITKNLVRYVLVPSMMRYPLQADLDMVRNEVPFPEPVNFPGPGVKS